MTIFHVQLKNGFGINPSIKERFNDILHIESLNSNNHSVIKVHIESNYISRIGVHT
jgi:hypothetical protein